MKFWLSVLLAAAFLLLSAVLQFFVARPRVALWSVVVGVCLLVVATGFHVDTKLRAGPPVEPEHSGFLLPANDPDPVNPCPGPIPPDALKIFLGNSLAYTTDNEHVVIKAKDTPLLWVRRDSEGLAVSAKIFSARDYRIVAELDDNEFHLNPANYFRKERPDSHTLVVYDQYANEVFRVRFLNPTSMKLTGMFHYKGIRPIIVEETRMRIGGNNFSRFCFGENKVDIAVG